MNGEMDRRPPECSLRALRKHSSEYRHTPYPAYDHTVLLHLWDLAMGPKLNTPRLRARALGPEGEMYLNISEFINFVSPSVSHLGSDNHLW